MMGIFEKQDKMWGSLPQGVDSKIWVDFHLSVLRVRDKLNSGRRSGLSHE